MRHETDLTIKSNLELTLPIQIQKLLITPNRSSSSKGYPVALDTSKGNYPLEVVGWLTKVQKTPLIPFV